MRKIQRLLLILSAFIIGFISNNFALSDNINNIAVVDIQQVVASSAEVKALKNDQEAKVKEFQKFIEKARKEVASTTDIKKKKTLEEKYNKELKAKQEANSKLYEEKLAEIDNSISNRITNYAKQQGYTIVISKNAVLYGGDDITEAVSNAVK